MGYVIEKGLDIGIDLFFKFSTHIFKIASPIKITPKVINGNNDPVWETISSLKIQNRLNTDLYNIQICGISKNKFDVKIISDDGIKGKTVEYMEVNTNYLSVHAVDRQTKNYVWIFRIHKLTPKEVFNLSIKTNNTSDIYLKTHNYEYKEIPVKERKDGVVHIPFKMKNIPRI